MCLLRLELVKFGFFEFGLFCDVLENSVFILIYCYIKNIMNKVYKYFIWNFRLFFCVGYDLLRNIEERVDLYVYFFVGIIVVIIKLEMFLKEKGKD